MHWLKGAAGPRNLHSLCRGFTRSCFGALPFPSQRVVFGRPRKVRTIERVRRNSIGPLPLHLSHFLRVGSQIPFGLRESLVVRQERMGSVEHTVTRTANLQTQIDIVERDREPVFVEASHLTEDLRPRHQARSGYRAHVSNHIRKIEVVLLRALERLECMAAVIIDAHDDPGVLNPPARV